MTTAERIKAKLVKAMAEKDMLNADYLLKMEILDEDIAKLQNELDNLETYGDMALVAEQTEPKCQTCKHYKLTCELFSEICKYEPISQIETQNSNLTFEKRTMRDCYNCKRYETEGECVECHYEPKDEPQPTTDCRQTERSE